MELIGECKGNNGNGCFMDSSGHNCGCFTIKERSYSEEEVINALHSVELKDNKDYSKIYNGMKEWFEQFKNK